MFSQNTLEFLRKVNQAEAYLKTLPYNFESITGGLPNPHHLTISVGLPRKRTQNKIWTLEWESYDPAEIFLASRVIIDYENSKNNSCDYWLTTKNEVLAMQIITNIATSIFKIKELGQDSCPIEPFYMPSDTAIQDYQKNMEKFNTYKVTAATSVFDVN